MKTLVGFQILALVAFAAAGCGGGGAANTADGGFGINGHAFGKNEEGAGVVYNNDPVPQPTGYVVELYNSKTDGCLQFRSNSGEYGTVLRFYFPLMPVGEWEVGLHNVVFSVDGNNMAALPKSGTLQVASFRDQILHGTYNITFVTGEILAGKFDAPICNPESIPDLGALPDAGADGDVDVDAGPGADANVD